MSSTSTVHMIDMYLEEAAPTRFLSSYFRSPPQNFHNSEQVEIDIERDEEEVAVVIQDLSVGGNYNEANKFSNKALIPPIYSEKGAVQAYEMIKRQAGVNPFQDPDFMTNARNQAFKIGRKCENKIRRAIELQASQVLQTGKLTLKDQNGATRFSLDYLPKSSHFPTVGTDWAADGTTGDPPADISSLAEAIRQDGKQDPTDLIFGLVSWQRFIKSSKVQALLDKTKLNLGALGQGTQNVPQRGKGASFKGKITIDNYEYNLWLYNGYYKDPQSGLLTRYMADDKVIMLCEQGRLDISFGGIPLFTNPADRPLAFLPPRVSSGDDRIDLTFNSFFAENGSAIFVEVSGRPLCIPTAIDTFGCIDVIQ